jgi:hypothetical protein
MRADDRVKIPAGRLDGVGHTNVQRRTALAERQADPRSDPRSPVYDPRFVNQTMELYKAAEREGWLLDPNTRAGRDRRDLERAFRRPPAS